MHDMTLDVFVANSNGQNSFFANNGDGTFTQITTGVIVNDLLVESLHTASVDYDNDGDLDIFTANAFGRPDNFLYRNDGNSNHWIKVKLIGNTSNRSAIGARIFVKANINNQNVKQLREINANPFNILDTHIGLGDATVIDSLIVIWPASGTTQIFTNVAADRFVQITEGINTIVNVLPCRSDLPPANPGFITGMVFSDTGNDCIFNSTNDFPVANRLIQATPGTNFVFSGSNGDYEFRLRAGTYNVSQAAISNDIWSLQTCQPNSTHTVSVTSSSTFPGNNFALAAISAPLCDAAINIFSVPNIFDGPCQSPQKLSSPCPNFSWEYCITVTNTGNTPVDPNSPIQVILDPNMVFLNIVGADPCGLGMPVINSCTPCTLTWMTPLILPGNSCTICFDVDVIANPTQGTTANFIAQCGVQTDFPTDQETHTDFCSCDPNDKLVAPKGCGPFNNVSINQPLTYTIRFQNTGTGPAHDVIVRDAMDADLDITTLKVLASSHTITRTEIIPDNALILSFEGIELPDSASDPQGSAGFVVLSITPKNGLQDGTIISNQAGIYFDFNEVVLTNTTLNTLRDNPEPVGDFEAKHSCTNTGLVYDFTYTGGTSDSAVFFWSFGMGATPQTSMQQNPSGIVFSSTGTHAVMLTITRFGCTATVTKEIEVTDVHCGSNKILICHKGKTLCISTDALQAHLSHGDCLSACITLNSQKKEDSGFHVSDESEIKISPNPFYSSLKVRIKSADKNFVEMELYNTFGQRIAVVSKCLHLGEEHIFEINGSNLPCGIYILKIHGITEDRYIKLIHAP